MTSTQDSLLDRLGGREVTDAAVSDLCVEIPGNPLLAPWFAGTYMGQHKEVLAAFVRMALRGGGEWRGRNLRQAHILLSVNGQRLGDPQFDAVVGILAQKLTEQATAAEVGEETIEEAIKEVAEWAESVRDEVLGREPAE